MGNLGFAGEQPVSNDAAHSAEWQQLVAGPRRRNRHQGSAWRKGGLGCGCPRRGVLDVLGHNAAARTGAGEGGEIDAFFDGQLSGEGGALHPAASRKRRATCRRRCCCRLLRGGCCCRAGGNGCLGCRRVHGAGRRRCFALGQQYGNSGADWNLLTDLHQQLVKDPVLKAFHLHGGLVRLNLRHDVPGSDLVPHIFAPLDEGALRHGVGELGHFDVKRHGGRLLGGGKSELDSVRCSGRRAEGKLF